MDYLKLHILIARNSVNLSDLRSHNWGFVSLSKYFRQFSLSILVISFLSGCALGLGSRQSPDLNAKTDDELITVAQSLDYKPFFYWFKSQERISLEQSAIKHLGARGCGKYGRGTKRCNRIRTPEQEKKILAVFFNLLDKKTHVQAVYWSLYDYNRHSSIILPKLIKEWEKYKKARNRFYMREVFSVLVRHSNAKHLDALPIFLDILADDESYYGFNLQESLKIMAMHGLAAIGVDRTSEKSLVKFLSVSNSWPVRSIAASILLKKTDEIALPLDTMIELIQQSNLPGASDYMVNSPLVAFFRLGSRAKKVAPLLKKMVLSENGYCPHKYSKMFLKLDSQRKCQERVAVVLWRIDPLQRKFLVHFFEKGIKNISMTTSAFYLMGKDALPAVPVLERNYKLSSGELRIRLALILERLTGKKYPETDMGAVPAIKKRLQRRWM